MFEPTLLSSLKIKLLVLHILMTLNLVFSK